MRDLIAGLLLASVVVAVPLVATALWVQVVLVDADAFADMSDEMLARDDVRTAVTVTIVDEIQAAFPETRQSGARPLLMTAVGAGLDTPAFQELFRSAVANAHRQLADGQAAIRLDLGDVLPVVANEVPDTMPVVADQLAAYQLPVSVTLVERDDRPELWTAFHAVRDGSLAVLAGFAAAVLAVLAFSRARGPSLMFMGVGGAAFAALTAFIAPFASRPLSAQREPVLAAGIDSAWGVIATSLQAVSIGIAVGFVAVAVAGITWFAAARTGARR